MAERTGAQGAWGDPAVLREGIVAGVIGAVSIALWFLIVDTLQGRPLNTPSILGTAVFGLLRGGAGIAPGQSVPFSFGMVVVFSLIHGATFAGIGIVGARLMDIADRDPDYGLFILSLLAALGIWFTFMSVLAAGVILNALSIPDIFIAHLLAVAAMGTYYWRRHPGMRAQFSA
ncbi:MAG: hypothetical protein V3V62_05235 [bacterium]